MTNEGFGTEWRGTRGIEQLRPLFRDEIGRSNYVKAANFAREMMAQDPNWADLTNIIAWSTWSGQRGNTEKAADKDGATEQAHDTYQLGSSLEFIGKKNMLREFSAQTRIQNFGSAADIAKALMDKGMLLEFIIKLAADSRADKEHSGNI